MLTIKVPPREFFDEKTEKFVDFPGCTIDLEHSLISVSKWESKWCVPFLDTHEKTDEQTIDYIRHMTITRNVPEMAYKALSQENLREIKEYIGAPMTATKISSDGTKASHEVVTSEIIYYWMITQNIPVEFQKWHLKRLLTLIRVCAEKNSPPKKRSMKEIMQTNRKLNAQRRAAMGSSG